MNLHDFYMGDVFDAYEFFGAHLCESGTIFRTYAPSAQRVTIIGEWNNWCEEDMYKENGIYTYHSPDALCGMMYKYVIYANGNRTEHCDPYGFQMELRPQFASIITNLNEHVWKDKKWLKNRSKNYNSPMNIYEVHLGSWVTNPDDENGWYSYSQIADKLINYVKEHGYTHIEVMPLSEHPADCSWGYQNTGFFSATSRYGKPSELMKLVDKCHKNNIGIIMDFVPVHFAIDGYGLAKYDGSCLYEYPSSDVGYSEWGTCNFIHSRREVCCFLQSAANFWLSVYHFDGIRMDAISRAIYWQGEQSRGVNGCTIEFIKKMNMGLHRLHPSAMLIAEDSTAFPKITAPVEYDGLGFDYKWDLGWMNDTLDYFRTPPSERKYHHHKLTFSMHYFYQELYILPFSHDENVHGKATIIQKMWGDYDQKFPQARAMYMYMYTHPGKKLNFMGGEIAQFREWDEEKEQDWMLLKYPMHDSFSRYIRDLSLTYEYYKALHFDEYSKSGFKWVLANESEKSIYAYERIYEDEKLLCVFNFSDKEQEIELDSENYTELEEIISSDMDIYSGKKKKLDIITAEEEIFTIQIPAFSGVIYKKIV